MVARRKVTKKPASSKILDTPIVEQIAKLPGNSIFVRALPALYGALIVMSFAFGVMWQRVAFLEKNGTTVATTATNGGQVAQATPASVSIDQIKGLFDKDVIKFGDANKSLLLVEVADPSCPYCHVASGGDPELNKQFGTQFVLTSDGGNYVAPVKEMKKLVDSGKASFVYLYMPGHGNGEMGQKALYCAHEKGKFWQAHDLLYSNKGYTLLNETVKNDKTKSGLVADFLKAAVPAADMKACLDSGKFDARLSSDTALSQSLAIQGTPGFFINTTRFAGAYNYKDMEAAVNTALGN